MLSNSEKRIFTVTGPVSGSELGHIQCHEHIWLRKGPSYFQNPALCMEDYEKSLEELLCYRNAGGGCIVDAQPGYFGRDAAVLQRLSRESGVKILAVTGFHKLEFMEEGSPLSDMTEDALAAHFTRELTEGMLLPDGTCTDIRAAFVKAALIPGGFCHSVYRKLLNAVARAAAKADAPVLVHTEKNTDLVTLVRFFECYGVRPERILVCHLDRTDTDRNSHLRLLETGCYLCYDSVNRLKYVSHQQELELLQAVLASGFGEKILLSLDTTAQRLRAYGAQDMGLDYILRDYIPMLRDKGLTLKQIHDLCAANAQALLTNT